MRAPPLAIALAVLLAPLASGAEVDGTLGLAGPIVVMAPATHDLAGAGLFCDETDDAHLFRLSAPRLSVVEYEAKYLDVVAAGAHVNYRLDLDARSYVLTDVVVELANGDHAGWWGAVADRHARQTLFAEAGSTVEAAGGGAIGNGQRESRADAPYFRHETPGPHLRWGPWEGMVNDGAIAMKVGGLDLLLSARENTTRVDSGWSREDGAVAPLRQRWILLEADAATMEAGFGAACEAAAASGAVAWDGPARLRPVAGELRSGGSVYAASGDAVQLEGRLRAALAPTSDGRAMTAAISGDVVASTLVASRVAAPVAPVAAPTLLLVLLAATTLGGLGLFWRERLRRVTEPPPEHCVAMAEAAAEMGDHAEALEWILRAKRRAPTSLRVTLDEAAFREALGEPDAAERLYARVRDADPSGEAAFHLARLLLARDDAEAAGRALSEALDRSPALLFELEGHDAFERLLALPPVPAAVARARRALDESLG